MGKATATYSRRWAWVPHLALEFYYGSIFYIVNFKSIYFYNNFNLQNHKTILSLKLYARVRWIAQPCDIANWNCYKSYKSMDLKFRM